MQLEVVEEVAADLARGNGNTLHFGEPEAQRLARQHVVLDLASEFEFAANAFLLDGGPMVGLDVDGHQVEGLRQPADLVLRLHLHARGIVALRDAIDALAQPIQVVRQPSRERHDGNQCKADERQPEAGVAGGHALEVVQRIPERPCDAERQLRPGGIGRGDDDPVGQDGGARRRPGPHRVGLQRLDLRLVLLGARVERALATHGKRHLAALTGRRLEHGAEEHVEVDIGIHLAHQLAVALEAHGQTPARQFRRTQHDGRRRRCGWRRGGRRRCGGLRRTRLWRRVGGRRLATGRRL